MLHPLPQSHISSVARLHLLALSLVEAPRQAPSCADPSFGHHRGLGTVTPGREMNHCQDT
jgi:hypothetical protein